MLTEQEKTEGWIEWDGGARPVDFDTHVDVKFRDGDISKDNCAGNWRWKHTSAQVDDIIAYRIIDFKDVDQRTSLQSIAKNEEKIMTNVIAKTLWDEYFITAPFTFSDAERYVREDNVEPTWNQVITTLTQLAADYADMAMAERKKRNV